MLKRNDTVAIVAAFFVCAIALQIGYRDAARGDMLPAYITGLGGVILGVVASVRWWFVANQRSGR